MHANWGWQRRRRSGGRCLVWEDEEFEKKNQDKRKVDGIMDQILPIYLSEEEQSLTFF